MEETKKKSIVDLAWDLYQNGSLIRWETSVTLREDFHKHNSYDMYVKSVNDWLRKGIIPESKKSKPPKKEFPIIKIPANGHPDWCEGARTWCFVYSKDHGNFILEGFRGEVEEHLTKNYTHYFCYYSMWAHGQSRGYWRFWKDNEVTIMTPSRHRKDWKYTFVKQKKRVDWGIREKLKELKFKRLPKQWIPEFNKF